MSKIIVVKLTGAGTRTGPFNILDNLDNVLAIGVSKSDLIDGYTVEVGDTITKIKLISTGKCKTSKELTIGALTQEQIAAIQFQSINTASTWSHLKDTTVYNKYYGNIEPYVIEYPFSYQSYDEILQNVKDFTRAITYLPSTTGFDNDNSAIEVNGYFNKAILYNGQQTSGLLLLVPKPLNNLQSYMNYPIYNTDSKTITYAKSDNFYQYNTFWGLVKDKTLPLFLTTCESLSIDKVLNQANMDYGKRSYKKEPLRAKFLKVRHILDDKSDLHLVSGFIVTPAQISYK
jgi:hypothetical protein